MPGILAVFVPQAAGAVLDEKKQGYGKLGSYGANTCCIIAAHCPETSRVFMAHIDNESYIQSSLNKINYWLRENASQAVNVHLLSGVGEWSTLRSRVERLKNVNIVQCSLGNNGESEQLLIDTRGNFTSEFEPLKDVSVPSDIEMTLMSMAALIGTYNEDPNQALDLILDEKNIAQNRRPPGCTASSELVNVSLAGSRAENFPWNLNSSGRVSSIELSKANFTSPPEEPLIKPGFINARGKLGLF